MRDHDPWKAVRLRLEAKRQAVNAEIAAYPPPIPACDAQFNHLLQQRAAVADALQRFEALQDADDLERFVAACPFLAEAGEGEQAS